MATHRRRARDGASWDGGGGGEGAGHVRALLGAYVDGELSPARAAAVAEHLAACAECSAALDALRATVGTLREVLTRHPAPDTLRVRIRAALRETPRHELLLREAARPGAVPRAAAPRRRAMAWWWGAAASLVIAALSSGATLLATRAREDGERVREGVLASHVRSLMPDHLTDVRSDDRHGVKPWFDGRLDFSPAVAALDAEGFPLLGGRLDYVGGRPVAVVVYGRRRHVINVFSWPTGARDAGVSLASWRGYHALHWRADGVEQWVVSDVDAAELARFAALLRRPAGR